MTPGADILGGMRLSTRSAIARSTQSYCSLISDAESLSCGVTFRCVRFRGLAEANQIREVVVDTADGAETAFESVERYFAEHGLQCHRWAPSIDADPAVLDGCLAPRGFVARRYQAMMLSDWPTLNENQQVRILPARPMRDAFRTTYIDASLAGTHDPELAAAAAMDRLDEAAMDMFVAVVDKKPVGRGGLFTVGDIGRVVDVGVLPEWRGQGVGRSLMRHILTLARRLMPRVVCLPVEAGDEAAGALLRQCGFVADGELIEFDRPPAGPNAS